MVRELLPWGWKQSFPAGRFHTVELTAGEMEVHNFGNWRYAVQKGIKFHDMNADGDRDHGEMGLWGWKVFADLNNNGRLDSGEPWAITDFYGKYTLYIQPRPEPVIIREIQLPGWHHSLPAGGYYEATYTSGEIETVRDFGNWRYAVIKGIKFHDKDRDGRLDKHEYGIKGVTIFADLNRNGKLDQGEPSAITDKYGRYELYVRPGDKKVIICEVLPKGWKLSYPKHGRYELKLLSGQICKDINFGNYTYHLYDKHW